MKLKLNNFNPEQKNNTISNDNYVPELNNHTEDTYQAQNTYEPDMYQSDTYERASVQPEYTPSDNLFKSAMTYNAEDTSITNDYNNYNNYNNYNDNIYHDELVNDNTISNVVENVILGPKKLREYAKNDLKFKPILALFLNYFTVVLSFSIISILLIAFLGVNKISMIACGIFGIILSILSIIILPDFVKIFLDLRRRTTYSKMFSNKNRALSLFALLLLKSLIFTLVALLFPVLGILITKLLGSGIVGLIINAVLYIIMFVLIIMLAIKYALSELMCVDNKGPVQSLKSSRKLMKGHTGRYIKSILPVIGWGIISSIVLSLLCALPLMIIEMNQGFNSTALAMFIISISLISCIFMIPLYSYWFMIKTEFYDNLLNKNMNSIDSKPKKTIIVGILLISLILILVSSAMLYLLPVNMYSSDISTNFLTRNDEMVDTTVLGVYLSIPESYTVTTENETDVYYAKNKRNTIHIKRYEDETDFDTEINEYNAVSTTIGTTDGYKFSVENSNNSNTMYGFSFMYNDCKYSIIGDNEHDVDRIAESIVEMGMMG